MQTTTPQVDKATCEKVFAQLPLTTMTALLGGYFAGLAASRATAPAPAAAAAAPRAARAKSSATGQSAAVTFRPTDLQAKVLAAIRARGGDGIKQGDIEIEGVKANSVGRALTGIKNAGCITSRGSKGNLVWFFQKDWPQPSEQRRAA